MNCSLFLLVLSSVAFGVTEENPIPTPNEARMQVESEMSLRESRETQKRFDLLSVPAESERVVALEDGGSLRIRRVSASPQSAMPRVEKAAPRTPLTEDEIQKLLAEAKIPKNLSISVTVYDEQVSEIRLWHKGEVYHVLSNVPFSHLQGLGSFETEEADWTVMAIVEEVKEEQERRIAGEARRFGATFTPRKRPDTSRFTSMNEPEYLVFPKKDQTVQEAVFAKLDALHAYYLANEKELAAEHRRREALAEARRRYREENPPVPQHIILNIWDLD